MAYWWRYDQYTYSEEEYDPFEESDSFTRAVWCGTKRLCNTSERDKKILTSLKDALNNLQVSAGNECSSALFGKPYFCIESSFSSENIHVTVEGVGDLKFPLEPDTVEKLSLISSKAKFGKGSDTLLDLKVRDTQMIPVSNLKVDIDDDAYTALVQEITAGLNIDSRCTIVPHLYNMLIYGPQQFFKRHTDTEKIENMVATLVVVLPSFYKGGDLVIRHGRKEYRFTPSEDPNKIKWIAFYPDCHHWIEKVTEGFRVVLTFNVEMKLSPEVDKTLSKTDINSELNKMVAKFFDGSDRPKKLIYLLNHSYSENSLKWYLLKGNDRIPGHALYLVAKNQNLVPCLALVVDEEFSVDHPAGHPEKMMSTIKIRYLVGEDSEKLLMEPAFPLEFGQDREICYTVRSMKFLKEFEYYGEGFSGNEASKRESRYHRACVIMCDASLVLTSSTNGKMKSLTREVIEAVNKLSEIGTAGAESDEARNEDQQGEDQKILVEGTLSSSEIVVSVENEGNLSYPLTESFTQKLIQMSERKKEVQPHVILPRQVNVEINNQVWSEMISNISSGLNVNSKCKLAANLPSLRMYEQKCRFRFCDLRHDKVYCEDLKDERGDITLVVILPGLTNGKFSIRHADNSCTISVGDKHECVNYIAFYSEHNIYLEDLKGTCLYLLYNLELQSDLDMHHEIDTCVINEPLCSTVKKYFSDDIKPSKLIYLLNHNYSKEKLRWHMLKGSDKTVAYAFYAVAKKQNLVPYLAYTEIREHWSDAFSNTITETQVELIFLVDEKNLEIKPSSDQFLLVSVGEVCFTMTNKVQSKPFKIDRPSLTENIYYYNRACVILCAN